MNVPERYRLKNNSVLGSNSTYGNNGFFIIPHPKVSGYALNVMVSDGLSWEHASVTVAPAGKKPTRCPTWGEMSFIKDLLWPRDQAVMQLHPPEAEYINCHPFCLHLWRPLNATIPLPDSILVGPPTPAPL